MSVLARLMPRGGAMERRTLESSAFVPPPQVGVIDDYVGVHRAMSSMTVMACVRLLSDTIASLPWKAYRKGKDGIPVEVDPQPAILRSPFPGFDLFQYKWMMVSSMALRGNFYAYVTSRDAMFRPTAILPLHPDLIFLERRPDILMWMDPIYRIMGQQVPSQDMVHIRRFTMAGEPWGLSPVKQAAAAIGMSLAAEEYGYRYFRESANPSGMLMTEQNLSDDVVKRQQQQWIASHGGRRLPAVLTGGFSFKTLTIAPNEAQFLETRQFQRSEIAMMYGIPPHMIGDTERSTSWGTGIEQQSIGAVTFTFRSWAAPIESVMTNLLPTGQYVRFDFNELTRGDIKARYDAYDQAIHSGWLNVNEVRRDEQRPPIGPDGEIYLQPVNYAPLGFTPVAAPPKAPPAVPPNYPEAPGVKEPPGKAGPPQPGKPNGKGTRDDIGEYFGRLYPWLDPENQRG